MSHKSKWRKITGVSTNHECYNCNRRINITETNSDIIVTCEIPVTIAGKEKKSRRTIRFNRKQNPYPHCGAWSEKEKEK